MGRTKEFDEHQVLEKAMNVFWTHGYENTSMQNLVDSMSIHRRSIYDTFGDKHHLFMSSLDLYTKLINKKIINKTSQDMNMYERLKVIFSILASPQNNGAGCLIVNTATELSNIDPTISKKIDSIFMKEEQQFFNILDEARKSGAISSQADLKALTYYLHNASVGLRVISKTTNDTEKINAIIDQTLSRFK